jgi:hypothetical protein
VQAKQNDSAKRYPIDMRPGTNLFSLGWALVVVAAICAAPALAAQPQTVADANKRFDVSGVVEAVSYVSNTLELSSGEQRLEIVITPTTAIELHGQAGSISDIRRGSKITASGVIRDGTWIANSVVVH